MSMLMELHLQDHEATALMTEHAEKMLNNPSHFVVRPIVYHYGIDQPQTTLDIFKSKPTIDENDPTKPGTSEEFMLSHDLNEINWTCPETKKIVSLETAPFGVLSRVTNPPFPALRPLIEHLEPIIDGTFERMSGHFIYPKDVGFMGWHTNSDAPGKRMYAVYAQLPNESYFRYVDRWSNPDKPTCVTSWDKQGWNFRFFNPSNTPSEYLWHCVHAGRNSRVSYGFFFR